MSNDKPKGIVDPWRKVEALRPKPKQPAHDKIDLDEIDRDADLAIPGRYVIRAEHSSIQISHVRIETPKDALDVLADCLVEIRKVKQLGIMMMGLGIGVRSRTGAWNIPPDDKAASTLKSSNATIWFVARTIDQGMLDLAKLLREPLARPIVAKWGVTPMLNG